MKHVTDQNWFAVNLDILVVIIGIFLGMQVTDWNYNQEIKKQVAVYKQRLILELKENISRIDNDMKYFNSVKQYADLVFRDIDKPEQELNADFIINVYQASQRTGQRVANFTINEINSTGMLKYFKEINIRQLIQIYDNSLKTNETIFLPLSTYRKKVRGIIDIKIQNEILEKCESLEIMKGFDSTLTVIKNKCNIGLKQEITQAQIKKLKRYSNIKQDLNYRVSVINWKLTYLGVYKQQAESLLLHLEDTKPTREKQ
jgi:hypothetical protein